MRHEEDDDGQKSEAPVPLSYEQPDRPPGCHQAERDRCDQDDVVMQHYFATFYVVRDDAWSNWLRDSVWLNADCTTREIFYRKNPVSFAGFKCIANSLGT